MIDSLSIENFRGIRSCSIEKFNQINVFFGKNNCGKSSLLEAIFLLSGFSNPQLLNQINRHRSYSNMTEDDLKLFFYNLQAEENNKIKISGSAKGGRRNLDISLFNSYTAEEITSDNTASSIGNATILKKGLKFNFSIIDDSSTYNYSSRLILVPSLEQNINNIQYTINSHYKEMIGSIYLPPNYFVISIKNLEIIIANKKQKNIVNALKKIDSKIVDIDIISGIIMIDIGLEKLVPINMLGDGIRKLLNILVAINFLVIHGGDDLILLIDEIENGLHYSSMAPLWREIFDVAIEKNIQIFIATHSMDCMKGLVEAVSNKKEWQEKLSTFSLVHKEDGELKAIAASYEQYEYSIEQGMEMR